MRIAEVIGKVTLNQCLPAFEGALLPLVVPLGLAQLQQGAQLREGAAWDAETLVVYDQLGAGQPGRIALSEGGEAAQPFLPELKPVDAYNAAILDRLDLEEAINDGQRT
jgi:ethanolamine utilization protein EutN